MKTEVLIPTLIKMINQKHLRKILARKIDDYLYKKIVVENNEDLEMVRSAKVSVSVGDAGLRGEKYR